MSLTKKLIASVIAVAVATLLFAVLTVGLTTNNSVREVVSGSVENRLTAMRQMQIDRIDNYFENILKVVMFTAENRAAMDANEGFSGAFSLTPKIDDTFQPDLDAFYAGDFTSSYRQYDNGMNASIISDITDSLDTPATFYQTRYIARNEAPIGEKSELMFAPKLGKFSNRYDGTHADYHTALKQIKDEFQFGDLLFVRDDGRVVYSVEKNIDYATSLVDGPFANTHLADTWRAALELNSRETTLSDYASYQPAFGKAVAFAATPVFTSLGQRAGTLIVQLDNERLTEVMTNDRQWANVGLGVTGEAYIVGTDRLLRTQSRFLLQDSADYFKRISQKGDQNNINAMRNKRSSVGLQLVDDEAVALGISGETGTIVSNGYLGYPVLAAYAPLTVKGNRWAIIVEIGEDEVFAEVNQIIKQSLLFALLTLVISVILASALGVFVSKIIISPIKGLVESFKNIAEGDGDLSVQLESANRKDEIGELSSSFNTFVSNIHNVVAKVVGASVSLRSVASDLATSAEENTTNVGDQRQLTQRIANTLSEFTTSTNDIVMNSSQAQEAMEQAATATARGRDTSVRSEKEMIALGAQTEQTVESIQVLSSEIENISQILVTINGIAEQTSLLALNAAIEAARAGEQGRGFAVVADEVRSLSSRTQQATIDIQQKIEGLAKAADGAVKQVESSKANADVGISLVKETAEELSKVQQVVNDIKSLNDAIDALANDQQSAAATINETVSNIETVSETTLSKTNEVSSSTNELAELANRLTKLVSRFKVNEDIQ